VAQEDILAQEAKALNHVGAVVVMDQAVAVAEEHILVPPIADHRVVVE
jgi:hypothetical protein